VPTDIGAKKLLTEESILSSFGRLFLAPGSTLTQISEVPSGFWPVSPASLSATTCRLFWWFVC